MKLLIRLLLLSLVVFTASCGGGGGGGFTPVAVLVYTTDWTNNAQPGGGVSQRISLLNVQGKLVKSLIANMSSPAPETYRVEGLDSGSYVLKVELFTQANLGGIKSGEFQAAMDLMGEVPFSSVVGRPVDSVSVSPNNVTVQAPRSQAFYATPRAASGLPTFAAANSFTWSVLGGVGTVTQTGTLITSTPASGSVRARHNPTSAVGSALVQVTPATIRTGKWTIFVFLNAANDLFAASTLNVNQMETVAGNQDVRFVLQWKQATSKFAASTFDGTRRVLVTPDSSGSIVSDVVQNLGTGVDMGRPQTMKEFLDWAKTYYPAQRYGVIVWNHGNGWRRKPNGGTRAVSYDDETGSAIQIWELKDALQGHHFDFLAWDASLMQMTEVAYEVRSFADYIIGSEESPPAEGYPYHRVFPAFRDNPDAPTRDLTKGFVDAMLAEPAYINRKITQSVLESAKLPALATSLDTLAGELMANGIAVQNAIISARNQAQSYSPSESPPRYYRDLIDLCEKLATHSTVASVDAACASVIAAARDALAWEGHNSQSAGSRGVSIDFTPGTRFLSSATDYGRLRFGADTRWDDWMITAP